ncbi:MAG: hypothetical protein ACE5Z5_07090 [Candidatus Bathyarchaeia archaeon]
MSLRRVEVKRIRPKITRVELVSGLSKPRVLDWAPPGIDTGEVLPTVREQAPTTEPDVVEWMQEAASAKVVLEGAALDYEKPGSELLYASGDGYIPGVSTRGIRFVSTSGYTVRDRGYGVVATDIGRFNVPLGGKTDIIGRDFLAWASLPNVWSIQWTGNLLRWTDLAKAPITNKVRFPSTRGLAAPQFFKVQQNLPIPVVQMTMGLQSDGSQALALKARDLSDYRNILFEDELEVSPGEQEATYVVTGLPVVPSFVLHLQPEDGRATTLTKLDVMPRGP